MTTMDQRETLLREFSDPELELLFAGPQVSEERLEELLQIIRCDIDAARLALSNELARINAAALAVAPHDPPLTNALADWLPQLEDGE